MGSIMAGASGYLLKETQSQEIVDAIRKVGAGRSLLDPAATASVLECARHGRADDVLAQLTGEELRVLDLIADGQTNREISGQINLGGDLVKNHVSNILGKLELSRQARR